MNNHDLGWTLISEGDTGCYFAKPFRRTKNYVKNILSYAWICKFKIENRPLCPTCHRFMKIARGKALRSRYWRCDNPSMHKEHVHIDWDFGLGPKAKSFLAGRRKETCRYNKKRAAEGKAPLGTAMLMRADRWVVTRPENKI
jgi:hypothetical protein